MEVYQLWTGFGMLLVTLITSVASYIKSTYTNRIAKEFLVISIESKANSLREKTNSEQTKVAKNIWEYTADFEYLFDEVSGLANDKKLY